MPRNLPEDQSSHGTRGIHDNGEDPRESYNQALAMKSSATARSGRLGPSGQPYESEIASPKHAKECGPKHRVTFFQFHAKPDDPPLQPFLYGPAHEFRV